MTFMAQDSKQDLPKVTYATALDIYMVLCYAFVLLTIVEFSLVHAFTKFNTGDPELRYLEKARIEEIKCMSSAAFGANGVKTKLRCSAGDAGRALSRLTLCRISSQFDPLIHTLHRHD